MDSILASIKKLLGLTEDYTVFDPDIIMCINSALMVLTQIGVGPEDGFFITGYEETWVDFIGYDNRIEGVKSYVHLKTKMLFDPSQSSIVVAAQEKLEQEYLCRINYVVDQGGEEQ